MRELDEDLSELKGLVERVRPTVDRRGYLQVTRSGKVLIVIDDGTEVQLMNVVQLDSHYKLNRIEYVIRCVGYSE